MAATLALIMAAVACMPVSAQGVTVFGSRDSAEVTIAAMAKLLGSRQDGVRVWVRDGTRPQRESGAVSPRTLSPAQWTAISEAYPAARLVTWSDTLFLCPPGVRVTMPVTGCPVREDGVIINLLPPRVQGDSVWIRGVLTRSQRTHDGHHTWASSADMLFSREDGVWTFRRFGLRATT